MMTDGFKRLTRGTKKESSDIAEPKSYETSVSTTLCPMNMIVILKVTRHNYESLRACDKEDIIDGNRRRSDSDEHKDIHYSTGPHPDP